MLLMEWHVSFRRALPILREGRYLASPGLHAAKRILTAAAPHLCRLISLQPGEHVEVDSPRPTVDFRGYLSSQNS